jgi:CRP-like cAMP-binding protein
MRRDLKAAFEEAVGSGDVARVEEVLAALESTEPDEPRWPHRRGDSLRQLGRTEEAIEAWARAVDRYARRGFLARAIAMAKTILSVDERRTDVLARVDPEAARAHAKPRTSLRPPVASSAPPQAPEIAPLGVTPQAMSIVPTLSRAGDAEEDEVRFEEDPSIEFELDEDEVGGGDADAPKEATAERLAVLPLFPLFAGIGSEALAEIARGSELVVHDQDGRRLVKKGELADALWAIVEGGVRITVPGREEQRILLREGELFGEACLLEGATRRADVFVHRRTTALRIPRGVLVDVVARHPAVGDVLFDVLARRLVGNVLATSELFAAFPPPTRLEIAKLFEVRRAASGTTLVEIGKRSDGLYVILAGKVVVGDDERGPGTVFGQRALLSRGPAERSVRAKGEVVVLRLPRARFNEIAMVYPPVLAHLADLGEQADASVSGEALL